MKFGEKMSSLMEGFTPKQLLMMAGVAGLLTFAVLYWGLSRLVGSEEKQEQTQRPTMQMVKVVQAKTDIKAREQLRESMLQLVEAPASMVPAGALTEIQGLAGRPTRVAIMAGDILTDKKLYQSVKESGFTGIIPPDRRAISVPVTDVTGVAGFLNPGDYVDVMFITEKMDSTRITGEIILQNVLLLGVNSSSERTENQRGETKEGDAKGRADVNKALGGSPMTATLAIRPEEELRLAVAVKAGQLYLALRPYKPANMYMLDTEYSFFKGRAAQTARPAASPAPSQGAYSAPSVDSSDPGSQMEIIRGTKASRGK